MFKSPQRGLIITQQEHARLAYQLAAAYGNDDFDLPDLPIDSFLTGVLFHDRGFGLMDEHEIGGMDAKEHLEVLRKGALEAYSDPVADLVARFHIRRLLGNKNYPSRDKVGANLDGLIDTVLHTHTLERTIFERTDRITKLCDSMSFDFCQELIRQQETSVFPRNDRSETTRIRHRTASLSRMAASPWPFKPKTINGHVLGYKPQGYPARLEPVLIPYLVEPDPIGDAI